MKRRTFLDRTLLASGLVLSNPSGFFIHQKQVKEEWGIKKINKKLAIAMWDFSWLLRHYRGGGFESWDQVLHELAERGYNAIRIDCFPHLIAPDSEGKIQEVFYHPKNDWSPALWGNQFSVYSNPREALLEFLALCSKYDIHVGLATWFLGHGTTKNTEVKELDGFVRVWNETLSYLYTHGMLERILYVDLLNEYPLWHGFEWLTAKLDSLSGQPQPAGMDPDRHLQEVGALPLLKKKYNPVQEKFYREFMKEAIKQLKGKWPRLDFFASLSHSGDVPWQEMDFSEFAALDSHIWFVHNEEFGRSTGYYSKMHSCTNDTGFEDTHKAIRAYWSAYRKELISWMESEIRQRSEISSKYNMACGNTEGWGAITWYEHPSLDWEFIKETAEICTDLSLKYGFRFICTSNFTHPHFPSLWKDVAWHRKITDKIRNG